MSIEILIPRYLHKERHDHHCPIHAKNKCKHLVAGEMCSLCMFQEDNEVCNKVLRGTGLASHIFPCVGCMTTFRNQYGGEVLIDAFINLEQAVRHAHVVPDAKLDEREAEEASGNPDIREFIGAKKAI